MKANELSIGDWVYSTFSIYPCQVLGIEVFEPTSGYGRVYVSNVEEFKDIFSLTEIPLTKEILEKNGFKSKRSEHSEFFGCIYYWKLLSEHILHIFDKDEVFYFCVGESKYKIKIQYVHQFQHLLRLIDYKEKIEL